MWPFRRQPPTPKSQLAAAQKRAARGDLEGAVALLLEVREAEPDNLAAVVNLGAVYYTLGRYTPAIEQFEHALRLEPDDPTVWLNLGAARNALGHLDKAIEALLKALELDPEHPEAHYNLAVAFLKRKQPLEALAELELELAVNPGNDRARKAAARLKAELLAQQGSTP